MRTFDDPSSLTPDERRSEIAAILAGGVLRLHARTALYGENSASACDEGDSPRISRIPAQPALRFPRKPCSVSSVVNGFRDFKTRRDA